MLKLLEHGAKATSMKIATQANSLSPLALSINNFCSVKLLRVLLEQGTSFIAKIYLTDKKGNLNLKNSLWFGDD